MISIHIHTSISIHFPYVPTAQFESARFHNPGRPYYAILTIFKVETPHETKTTPPVQPPDLYVATPSSYYL